MDLNKELQELKEKVTPFNTIKFISGTIISLGAAAAFVGIFKEPLRNAKGITKLMMKLGIFVLGCKAGEVAENYFTDTMDETIRTFKEAKEEVEKE